MEPLTDDDTRRKTYRDMIREKRDEFPDLDDEDDIQFILIWGFQVFQQEHRP